MLNYLEEPKQLWNGCFARGEMHISEQNISLNKYTEEYSHIDPISPLLLSPHSPSTETKCVRELYYPQVEYAIHFMF